MSSTDRVIDTAAGEVAETAGRVGLVTRGVLYLIAAVLTVRVATRQYPSAAEEGPGKDGALRAVAEQPFGRLLVAVLMVGLGGYALWRFAAAVTYRGDADDPATKVWAKRVGHTGRGLIYLVGIATAASLLGASDLSGV